MADQAPALPQPTAAPDLAQQILDAPEPIWRKLKEALGVGTRQQAVELVQTDQEAAAAAAQILAGTETVATARRAAGPETVATAAPRAPAPMAERIYGGKGRAGAKVTF